MAWHKAFIEICKASGGLFMLFCIAAALGILLLTLFIISSVTSLAKRNGVLKIDKF